jgi:hypothetical protein
LGALTFLEAAPLNGGVLLNAYEAIRNDGARFFVAPGHEQVWYDVERVTVRTANYWVVEKLGRSGAMAREADARLRVAPRTTIGSCSTNLGESPFALAVRSALCDENRDAIGVLRRLLEGAAGAPAAPGLLDPPA